MQAQSASVDPADVERFERLGARWWDPRGPMRPLHLINPLRLRFVEEQIATRDRAALPGLSVLDIGCGGGLFSEALAKAGALVTGVDPSPGVISVASQHAAKGGLSIDYRAQTAEALADSGAQFDMVCAMEVLEHVVDMPAFVATACRMVKPGGWFFAATLNRTLKSFALAIVGAEYVLGWVPKGTHQWEKFITPAELEDAIEDAGLAAQARAGVVFQPLRNKWTVSRDTDVNYMMSARRL
jgi:2-polyprenyl-6-hydroxyphenyl methylase/3-demethylubiquinone-9 3-methyltransferase